MNTGSKRQQPRRRDEARGLFRNAILEAAEEVFATAGYHAARIQDVARAARIAVGTVYNHFDSKDELLAALMEERAAELLHCLEAQDGDPTDVPGRLLRRVERMLTYVDAHRGFYALLLTYGPLGGSSGETVNMVGRSQRRWQKFRSAFAALIEEGVASGLFERELADEL